MLVRPHHVRDLHRDVVDGAREVVQRAAVGPHDHEIADLVGRELDVPLDQVVQHQLAPRRHLKPQGEGPPLRLELGRISSPASSLRRNR